MCTSSVSNVIYHTFSHGAAFYTLNGKNVNVMLEFSFLCNTPLKNHRLTMKIWTVLLLTVNINGTKLYLMNMSRKCHL